MPYRNLVEPLPTWRDHLKRWRGRLVRDVVQAENEVISLERGWESEAIWKMYGDKGMRARYREAVEKYTNALQVLKLWDEMWALTDDEMEV